MKRFLFAFGYESPIEHAANKREETDFESSNAVWVRADSEDEALRKGRAYATQFVCQEYEQAGVKDFRGWAEGNFAHWIVQNPMDDFTEAALKSFEEI